MHLLDAIQFPSDLKKLSENDLQQVAAELRAFLISTLNQTGGHFGAGLGTIELAIALHYVFNTPHDTLIWDVGHQAYPHKMLTGRKDQFLSLRKKDGLAPFPRREESLFDAFGVGHSSTSISAALGMSVAKKYEGNDSKTVAIIGDGAMTAGMAFEALNHGGDLNADLLVVLNDNDMSISGNVGALSNYFARILSGKLYTTVRAGSKKMLARVPPVWELARRTESHLKGMVAPGTLFEELGFNYIGPIDGHDLNVLVKTLRNVQSLKGPQFLHVITKKGKGYPPAEADPIKYHAVSKGFYDAAQGSPLANLKPSYPSFSQIFGKWLCDMAAKDDRLIGITPAMREGSDLIQFSKDFPDRYFDVGIAEQHSVTFAAGLATEGRRPVVAIYSTFLQRAYDQLIHDVAIQNLPVLFALDRAGLVPDGPTHCGSFDLSYLTPIPNMTIMAPSDSNECRHMLYTGFLLDGPAAVRYPRGTGPIVELQTEMIRLPIGKGVIRQEGQGVAILSFGTLLPAAMTAAVALGATVVDMRFIKPIDEALIIALSKTHHLMVTIEENAVIGGAGALVNQVLLSHDYEGRILNLGIPDYFVEHASHEEMLASCGLDAKGIQAAIQAKLNAACKKMLSPLE
ncbi:MAG: 1-deoxy-D-xylulose-5-phosphate synthase [Gammaproteobacteria bacterium]